MTSPSSPAIALIGDYSTQIAAHRAIPLALEQASRDLGVSLVWSWVGTQGITDPTAQLPQFSGVWVTPGSPYANMAGVLAAARWARESGRPILGTCGGFQHMLIEVARNLAHLPDADHAETHPAGKSLVISRLACSLAGHSGLLQFSPGSLVHEAYNRDSAVEAYQCNFGPDAAFAGTLENAGLRFTARDELGEIRAAELPRAVHPFFVGTLFQPERAALRNETPPLARAFVEAVASFK